MSGKYKKRKLKARIAALEAENQRLSEAVKQIATLVTHARTSPFDDPWTRFFNEPEFWEIVYVDQAACQKRALELKKRADKACYGDSKSEECKTAQAEHTAALCECYPSFGICQVP
jgi:hypothetical protein